MIMVAMAMVVTMMMVMMAVTVMVVIVGVAVCGAHSRPVEKLFDKKKKPRAPRGNSARGFKP
jgi:hypothetical protein